MIPVAESPVNVPTLVILVCATLVNVPPSNPVWVGKYIPTLESP